MKSEATSVAEYLAELPEDRRKALAKLRALIRKSAPGVKESIQYGMPTFTMGAPILGLGSQKHYMALYVCYSDAVERHRKELGKLSCGKGCIRFKSLDDLPMDVVATIIKELVDQHKPEKAAVSKKS